MTFRKTLVSPTGRLICFLCGAVVSLILLATFFSPDTTDFEVSATLGTNSKSLFASKSGFRIHCSNTSEINSCLSGQADRGSSAVVLWLGNSQVHEVNQWRPGETTAVPILFDSLAESGRDLMTFSMGNANLQEHYVIFESLRHRMPLKMLILQLVFDDTRETGLRPDLGPLVRDSNTEIALMETKIGRRILSSLQSPEETGQPLDSNRLDRITFQESSENNLTGWLEKRSQLWQLRSEVRGWAFIGLYRLRNFVFGITPTTIRKKILGRYVDNLSALDAILDRSRSEGIEVLVYIAPLRGSGGNIPYDLKEYEIFKLETEAMAQHYGVNFINLEKLVPDGDWGTKASTSFGEHEEFDFMHFRHKGHVLLAKSLHDRLMSIMTKSAPSGPP